MAFIRIKKIKKKGKQYNYAYIVENKWKKGKVKQKVKKYLGRVYRFERLADSGFEEFISMNLAKYIKERDARAIIVDLVRWELDCRGFKEKESIWVNGSCAVDMRKIRVRNNKGSQIAIELNEGLLNEYKLRRFLKLNFGQELSEQEAAYKLAKEFVENGIAVPHEVFVAIFGKIFK